MSEFSDLRNRVRAFSESRDWAQFHSPKNLAMALIAEAGELVEQFQWMTESDSKALDNDKLEEVGREIADIQIYLVRLSDVLGIDIYQAVGEKMTLNEKKYPVDKVRGSSKKYTEY